MSPRLTFSVGVLFLLLVASSALGRTWTSQDGKTIEADFVDVDEERATLKLSTGKEVKVKLELLCDEDQRFLRGILARRRTKNSSLTDGDSGTPAIKLPIGSNDDSSEEEEDRDSKSKKKLKAENRTWTDVWGKNFQGKFIRIQGSTVVLLRGGRQATTDYWQLSAEDQEYVKEFLEAKDLAHLIPKVNTNNAVAGNNIPAGSGAMPAPNFAPNPIPMAPVYTPMPSPVYPDVGSMTTTTTPTYPSPAYPSSAPPSSTYTEPAAPPSTSYPGSSIPGSSYTGPSMPNPSYPSAPSITPTIPTYEPPSFQTPTYQQVKICTNCNKEVGSNVGAGDSCPHCGTYFAYDETTGKHASVFGNTSFRPGRGLVKLVIGLVVLIIGGIASAVAAAAKAFGGKSKQEESRW